MPINKISKKQKDGRYRYSITDAKGKTHHLTSRKNETRTDFSLRCDDLDRNVKSLGSISSFSDDRSFDSLFTLWITTYGKQNETEGRRKNIDPNLTRLEVENTWSTYKNHVQPFIGDKDCLSITRADVFRLLQRASDKDLSRSMISKIRGCVSRPFNWAINTLGLQVQSPTTGLIFKVTDSGERTSKRDRAIDDFSLDRFMTAAEDTRYYSYFYILNATGLRPSEALGLKITDFSKKYIEVRRGVTRNGLSRLKTKNAVRDIPLTPEVKEEVERHVSALPRIPIGGWLFATAEGLPSMTAMESTFKRVRERTALWLRGGRNGQEKLELWVPPVAFALYDFRHTFATRMAMSGMNAKALQMIMGHSSITTTLDYYVHLPEEEVDRARDLMSDAISI